MADTDATLLESRLRSDLAEFLETRSPWREPLLDALHAQTRRLPSVCLFGGALRDIAIHGPSAAPLDIDIVVGNVPPGELEPAMSRYLERRTRLGGYHLKVGGVEVDLWPLRDTWAFHRLGIADPTFADLPRTTFLNVEAVAVQICPHCTTPRSLYTQGFFEAIRSKTVEVNYEVNPAPEFAVLRSVALANRLGFFLGPKLLNLATRLFSHATVDELFSIQQTAREQRRCSREVLQRLISSPLVVTPAAGES